MDMNFDDPQSFLSGSIFSYLAPPGNGVAWSRCPAIAKRFPEHFIVRERTPAQKDRYLSVGQDSDFPAEVLGTLRHADSVVVATMVKERLVTWAAIDWLADLLTKVLGRKIWPEQIRHCGLKDRWAVTAQSIIIFGVTVDELKRVHWPHTPGKTGFFLKDIRWHDGRRRLHPSADERRNWVKTEVIATCVKTASLDRDAMLYRLRQHVCESLKRELPQRDFSAKGNNSVVIANVSVAELSKVVWPANLGVSLKDARIYKSNALSKGDHRQNRFELKIVLKGKNSDEVKSYIEPLMARLGELAHCIPNAVGFQRLAARQLGHLHGYTLVTGDYTPPKGKGVHDFGSASEAALYRFLHETSGRENPAAEQLRREMEPCWLYDFPGMKQKLGRQYRSLNMSVEYKLVERLADNDRYRGDFQEVVRSMNEEVSMWVAAWQSWWWNQVLVRKLPHWVREAEQAAQAKKTAHGLECSCTNEVKDESQKLRSQCGCDNKRCNTCQKRARLAVCQKCRLEAKVRNFNPLDKGIPLLMDSTQSREYYQRLAYCSEGVEQLDMSDSFVREQFLKPRGNTPWRKAFIRVEGLEYSVGSEEIDGVEQTVVNLNFELPSGAYATTFLGLLFELEEPNKGAAGRNPESEPDLADETE